MSKKKLQQTDLHAEIDQHGKKKITQKQKNLIYTGIFFAIVLILFIVNNLNGEPDRGPYPPYYLESTGKLIQLSELQGKIVILDFWATWCAPCRRGIPDLVEIKKEFGDKGVEIIGISLDGVTRGGQTKQHVIPFIEEFKINYPIVFGDQNTMYQYGVTKSIPTTFVLDREGSVVSQYEGLVPKQTFINDIEKILTGKSKVEKVVKAPDFKLSIVNQN